MRGVPNQMPPVEYLMECFDYSEGRLVWKTRPYHHFSSKAGAARVNARCAGKYADAAVDAWGYRLTGIAGVVYKTHRVIWKMITREEPKDFLDHRNGVRSYNDFENLRPATKAQNAFNKGIVRAKSGFKGVMRPKPSANYWLARIAKGGKTEVLGKFATKEAAHAAYVVASQKLFGEYATAGRVHKRG